MISEHTHDAPSLEKRVQNWCVECFGQTTAEDVTKRTWRFLEEALELAQSLGADKSDVLKLADYTFSRQKGQPNQELGGVMVTLAALSAANHMDMMAAFNSEFARINRPETVAKIRAKHATKPLKSPLPGTYPDEEAKAAQESAPLTAEALARFLDPVAWQNQDHLRAQKSYGPRFNVPATARSTAQASALLSHFNIQEK